VQGRSGNSRYHFTVKLYRAH